MIAETRAKFPADMYPAEHDGAGPLAGVANDLLDSVKSYIRRKPEEAALLALGIGFVLGWKLKPW